MVVVLLLLGLETVSWPSPQNHPSVLSSAATMASTGLLTTPARSTSPPAPTSPGIQQVKVGMMVTKLYNFRPNSNSFDAELWLWGEAPPGAPDPLKSTSFTNSFTTTSSDNSHHPVRIGTREHIVYFQKVRGSFQHDWNLAHFPFDRQNLQIILEEDEREVSEVQLVPDSLNTNFDANLSDNWRLIGFSAKPDIHTYNSNFGLHPPSAQAQTSYAKLVLTIGLERTSGGPLLRLGAAPLAGVVIVMLSYGINLSAAGALPARGGLIGAALFAEILSLRAVSGPIYNGAPLTLIERLHLLGIAYTIVGAAILSWQVMQLHRGVDARSLARLDLRAALISSLLLIPLVSLPLLRAMHSF